MLNYYHLLFTCFMFTFTEINYIFYIYMLRINTFSPYPQFLFFPPQIYLKSKSGRNRNTSIECRLVSCVIFQAIRTSIAKKPYFFFVICLDRAMNVSSDEILRLWSVCADAQIFYLNLCYTRVVPVNHGLLL